MSDTGANSESADGFRKFDVLNRYIHTMKAIYRLKGPVPQSFLETSLQPAINAGREAGATGSQVMDFLACLGNAVADDRHGVAGDVFDKETKDWLAEFMNSQHLWQVRRRSTDFYLTSHILAQYLTCL